MNILLYAESKVAERHSSAAAAALRAVMSRGTSIAAAVCCSVWFGLFCNAIVENRVTIEKIKQAPLGETLLLFAFDHTREI